MRIRTPDRDDAPGTRGNVPGDGPHDRAGLGDCPLGRAAALPTKTRLCRSEQRLEGDRRGDSGTAIDGPDRFGERALRGSDRAGKRLDSGDEMSGCEQGLQYPVG